MAFGQFVPGSSTTGTTTASSNWPGLPFTSDIDAVSAWPNGKAYFFKGNEFVSYDIAADRADPGYPQPINSSTWPGLTVRNGIDAVAAWPNGKAYFFKDWGYVSYDIATQRADPGYPQLISTGWPGLPFTSGVDAVSVWPNGKAYFFKGAQYVRYDIATRSADPGYPQPISAGWSGLPFTSGVDAVSVWPNGKAYFFKGAQYVRYDTNADRADPGYPQSIGSGQGVATPTSPSPNPAGLRIAEVDGLINQAISDGGQKGFAVFWTTNNSALYTGWPQTVPLPKVDPGYEYSVIAFCDSLCRSINFELIDTANKTYPSMPGMISFQPSARSARLDAIKPDWFSPPTSVKVTMTDCAGVANTPCQWGLVVLRRPLQTTPTQPTSPVDARAAEVETLITSLKLEAPRQGLEFLFDQRGALNSGGVQTVSLGQFYPGYRYSVVAVCDGLCAAINLDLIDAAGQRTAATRIQNVQGSARFVGADAQPAWGQPYSAMVTMSGCASDPCRWGLVVTRMALQGAAPVTPNPVTPSTPSVPVGTPSVPGGLQLTIDRDDANQRYVLFADGDLLYAMGRQDTYVAVNFEFWNGKKWKVAQAAVAERDFHSSSGAVAIFRRFSAQSNSYDLGGLGYMYLPYYVLLGSPNMRPRPGETYRMKAIAYVKANETEVVKSRPAQFDFTP
jgi:hypothetical protein